MTEILMIEDNRELGTLVGDFLKREDFSVTWKTNAEDGLQVAQTKHFGIILLDVMLPGMDGFETCSRLRTEMNVPILMMSARTDDSSKLLGYETGADDYIDKPFAIPVLVAKIKALLRRSGERDNVRKPLEACGITLDYAARRVTQNGRKIVLTGKTFDILYYFMQHKGELIEKEKLFNEIWGADCFSEQSTMNVHIRWLREKLEKDPKNPELIKTVWKVGYRFGEE